MILQKNRHIAVNFDAKNMIRAFVNAIKCVSGFDFEGKADLMSIE